MAAKQLLFDEAARQSLLRGAGRDAEVQIGPQKRGLHMICLLNIERTPYIRRHRRRGRGGEREHGLDAEFLCHQREAQVGVVALDRKSVV